MSEHAVCDFLDSTRFFTARNNLPCWKTLLTLKIQVAAFLRRKLEIFVYVRPSIATLFHFNFGFCYSTKKGTVGNVT